jgi:hypothetical protein
MHWQRIGNALATHWQRFYIAFKSRLKIAGKLTLKLKQISAP